MLPRIGITSSGAKAPTAGTIDADGQRPTASVNLAYVEAVAAAGGLPLVLPSLPAANTGDVLATIDGLLLSGGGDIDPSHYGDEPHVELSGVDRRRDEWELALARAALDARVPVLGICRGCQVLNVACGGSLVQHLPDVTAHEHRDVASKSDPVHRVAVSPSSVLATVLCSPSVGVNSIHHQAVATPGRGLRPVAWSRDGTVEAVEALGDGPVLGVQWHPELLTAHQPHRALFEWIVHEAARHAARGRTGVQRTSFAA